MTQYEITTPGAPATRKEPRTSSSVTRDGLLCTAGGLILALGAGGTALLPTDVPDTRMSYPFEPGMFVFTSLLWTVSHVLTLFGALGLTRAGVAAASRAGRVGVRLAIAGMALLIPAEASLTLVAHAQVDDPLPMAISSVFGVAVILAGVGLTLAGAVVLRHGTWTGWGRWTPLLAGLFVLLVSTPVQVLVPSAFLWGIAGWGVCLTLLGAALIRKG